MKHNNLTHPRLLGVLAAREYILTRKPEKEVAEAIEKLGFRAIKHPGYHGMRLTPQRRRRKNILGKVLATPFL